MTSGFWLANAALQSRLNLYLFLNNAGVDKNPSATRGKNMFLKKPVSIYMYTEPTEHISIKVLHQRPQFIIRIIMINAQQRKHEEDQE